MAATDRMKQVDLRPSVSAMSPALPNAHLSIGKNMSLLKKTFVAAAIWMMMILSAPAAEKITYVYTDPQGTPLAEADINGNVTSNFDYRPYGGQSLGAPAQGPGYTGHVQDPDTSLVYMQQRYYDPGIGRFLSADPIALNSEGGDTNRYRYAANNPVRYIDPDGRQECASCERAYGGAVGYMLRNNPQALQTWANGEAAATTTAGGALEGASSGLAVGKFVDSGDYSARAVVTVSVGVFVGILTHGKSAGPGAMHGPSPRVHAGKQGKHQVGHNNFDSNRSILTANPEELGRYAGTGQQVGNIPVSLPGSKERVNFNQVIGTFKDGAGNSVETTNGIFHYAKDGFHVVPSRPSDEH